MWLINFYKAPVYAGDSEPRYHEEDRGANEQLPGRYVAALLHERCQSEPEAVDDAEIVRHARRRHMRRSLRSMRMLQRGVVPRGHRRIPAAA